MFRTLLLMVFSTSGGVFGLRFATWAPRAVFVSVVGDWNNWDGRACPMAKRFRAGEHGGFCGLWEVFVTWSCNVFGTFWNLELG